MRVLSIIICLFLLLAALAPAVAAEEKGRPDQASGARGSPDEAGNQSTDPPLTTPAEPAQATPPLHSPGIAIRETVRAERSGSPANVSELKNLIRTRQQVHAEEVQELPLQAQARYAHENEVRTAVFALLAAENMTGIGPSVAQVARNYNASVNAQWREESAMEQRSGIMLTLFGGDREAANRIRMQAEENERRIEEIRSILMTNSSIDPNLSMILLEQLGRMEEEQNRLSERAQIEEQKRGIFGWIFG